MHTPGPWTAFEKDGKHVQADEWSTDCEGARSSTHAPIKAGSQVVALVVASARHWPDLPDITSNCHLIAAAPELLAALTDLLTEHESDISSEYGGTTHYAPMMAELQPYRDLIAKAKGAVA